MRRFQLNKLVRDGILDDMKRRGQQVEWHKLDVLGKYRETGHKVAEETSEFDPAASREKKVQELADHKEANMAADAARKTLAEELGISEEEIETARQKRLEERGDFAAGIFVATVTLADDDEFTDYYAKNPERFPELPVENDSE